MPDAINDYLRERRWPSLRAQVESARCIMESLALRSREVLRQVETLLGGEVNRVHALGGGSCHARLNQWLVDAPGIPVIAGPAAATAPGNALVRLAGLGEAHTLAEIRVIAQRAPARALMLRTN